MKDKSFKREFCSFVQKAWHEFAPQNEQNVPVSANGWVYLCKNRRKKRTPFEVLSTIAYPLLWVKRKMRFFPFFL
ncbi:MAG: hypothetical protein PHR24_00880, partial [Oscillospiraceae bacterium]|nr:hypothetical protein [Oscillospiraceae bacterium]